MVSYNDKHPGYLYTQKKKPDNKFDIHPKIIIGFIKKIYGYIILIKNIYILVLNLI